MSFYGGPFFNGELFSGEHEGGGGPLGPLGGGSVGNFFGGQFFGSGFFGASDVVDTTPPARGTAAWLIGPPPKKRTRKELSEERERFGLLDEVALAAIAEVAARQAATLERDEQKRFEELIRELQLRKIDWRAEYLESLNIQRERLIDAEIARLLRLKQDRDVMALLALAAAAAS